MWKSWKVAFGAVRPVSSLLEKLCVCAMTEEAAAPSAKRQCTEERSIDRVPELSPETTRPLALAESREGEEDVGESASVVQFQRIKRKKCALLLSYNGKGYLGMQANPGMKTIEADLLEALAQAEAYPHDMKTDVSKLQFQRCSRTDKNVSAARQVVSLKISEVKESVAELANKYLSPQIRVMGFRRVTKSFNSKTACTARSYEYLMPTYAFAPYRLTTLDYRIDDSTLERVQRLLKIYEKSHNFHNFTSGKRYEEQSAYRYIMSFTCGSPFVTTVSTHTLSPHTLSSHTLSPHTLSPHTLTDSQHEGTKGSVERVRSGGESREPGELGDGVTSDGVTSDGVTSDCVTSDGVTSDAVTSDGVMGVGVTSDGVTSDGVISDGVTSDGVISDGVTSDGVTSGGVTSDGVTSDGVVGEPVRSDSVISCKQETKKEVEFLTLQVKGQSFMIHQIRKMVGLVIAIVRGFTPETTLIEAFKKSKVDIPRAPALGLLLDNVYYDGYNKKFASDKSHDILDWRECNEKVESFKKQHIHQSIVDAEISEMSMMQWLGSLQIHEFYQTRERLALAQEQKDNQTHTTVQEDDVCSSESNKTEFTSCRPSTNVT